MTLHNPISLDVDKLVTCPSNRNSCSCVLIIDQPKESTACLKTVQLVHSWHPEEWCSFTVVAQAQASAHPTFPIQQIYKLADCRASDLRQRREGFMVANIDCGFSLVQWSLTATGLLEGGYSATSSCVHAWHTGLARTWSRTPFLCHDVA